MTGPFIVALDQGTSSCRAVAVDQAGRICAQKHKSFFPYRARPGLSEYKAQELLQIQLEVLHGLLDEIGPEEVVALTVCSQRSTVVLWDGQTGHSLAPVLTWEDGRAQQEADQAPLTQPQIHQQTGLFKTPYFSAPKIAWCFNHFPQVQSAAQTGNLRVAPVASYLIWYLTKGKTFATDPTLAQRTLLWDIQQGTWSESLCHAFGVPLECLPTLLPTISHYGSYLYKGVKLPICACVADQQAAAAYEQISKGNTLLNLGTGAFVLHPVGSQPMVLPGLLSSVAASVGTVPSSFLLEGPVFAAGSVVDWLKTKGFLAKTEELDKLASAASHPVHFLPSFGGIGAPYWNYNITTPVWENVSAQTTSADWAAGTLAGIAHLVADIIDYSRIHGLLVTTLSATGGLSRSAYLLQLQANILQLPIRVLAQTEGTVLGSAYLAAQQLGWQTNGWHPTEQCLFLPNIPPEQARNLRQSWQAFIRQSFNL